MKILNKPVALLLIIAFTTIGAGQAIAGPIPSKTADNQSLASRAADLQAIRSVMSHDEVARALAAQGFTAQEVNAKLASLSAEDLHSLSQNLDQIQAAGVTRAQWLWIAIGAIAALIIVIAID